MDHLLTSLHQIWVTKSLRDKLLFTIFALIVFRIAAHISIPGADVERIRFLMENAEQGGALGVFSLLTGGAMERFSLVLMGLTPYINASIIMQLLGVLVPSIENLKKEGEQGQKKINQWTRLLTVPLAFVQSYGMMVLLNNLAGQQIVDTSNPAVVLPMMLIVTAGTIFLMWLGELINERGIGNGVSILIFAGIVATVPPQLYSTFRSASLPVALALVALTVGLTLFVVYVTEANRNIPVTYAVRKSSASQKSFLPLKINQAGMIPIIFAVSLVSLPSIIAGVYPDSTWGQFIIAHFSPQNPGFWYNLLYAALIFAFTFFYVDIVFEPKKIAENIQKRGGFVPGYRPGRETEEFIAGVANRLCFWGAIFLTFVAIVPLVLQFALSGGVQSSAIALLVSGAGIIIIVSVVLDIIRRINAHLVMQDYDKL
ncbi:preprotein translocase subunit SecY [Candidatus Peribacteria bacterium]|nr:preprotein translocase subunit SecY [Candidatus Peribacteria bacterium]